MARITLRSSIHLKANGMGNFWVAGSRKLAFQTIPLGFFIVLQLINLLANELLTNLGPGPEFQNPFVPAIFIDID